ncbi:ZIP zinc transporter [Cercophora scortea]|uniref:ZIP zinc transporter n=1 Tax=Cercophora scortea TaxID=314031 RepID=A0AAE0MIU2_9PEZI|nr:ZIP zinc transporter [Cercophora scortea]
MDSVGVDNDTRGWILCTVSGIACVFGACIICVDVPIRLMGKRDFRIEASSVFLACSLSLSFGVMIFSALYSMLPSAIRYLAKDEWNKQAAGFLVMGFFVGGFVGIQIISRLLHRFIPSHVVDCDHTHADGHSHPPSRHLSRASRSRQRSMQRAVSQSTTGHQPPHGAQANGHATESTPLLSPEVEEVIHVYPEASRGDSVKSDAVPHHHHAHDRETRNRAATTQTRRPSMMQVPSRVLSFVKDTKPNCDEFGPCFGYSDPCGQECFKHISTRSAPASRSATLLRTTTGSIASYQPAVITNVAEDHEEEPASAVASPVVRTSRAQSRDPSTYNGEGESQGHSHHVDDDDDEYAAGCCSPMHQDIESQGDHHHHNEHHHHVPKNAYLSISAQTVIAISLHKFPEGFITYATTHASPALGFNVFMALSVHNIAEGFAMALPLYMALGSRFKAILWSSLLGGLSQPMGAAMAVLWFKVAKRSHYDIDNTAYAVLFAVTAGIMTSVALQLFVESLSLNHNRNLSIFFAFLGMTLLGVSNALVAN